MERIENEFRILHWNVSGMKNVKKNCDLLRWADILMLQETWIEKKTWIKRWLDWTETISGIESQQRIRRIRLEEHQQDN